jgi:hypothetical protein
MVKGKNQLPILNIDFFVIKLSILEIVLFACSIILSFDDWGNFDRVSICEIWL